MPTKKTTSQSSAKAAKKVVKKVVAKKVAKKAVAKRKPAAAAARSTVCVCTTTCTPEQAFWVNNGPIVASIAQLKEALQTMTQAQFEYHTRREGNDFARWVRECLDDAERASLLEKAKTKATAARALQGKCCK